MEQNGRKWPRWLVEDVVPTAPRQYVPRRRAPLPHYVRVAIVIAQPAMAIYASTGGDSSVGEYKQPDVPRAPGFGFERQMDETAR